jgi:hypothetical protein
MQHPLIAALSGIATVISVTHAAQASAIQLTYSAPPGCPSSAEFLRALDARGADVQLEAASRVIAVTIEQSASGYTGRLQVEDEQGTTRAREASAGTCPEVADAMAAVGALILAPPPAEPTAQPSSTATPTTGTSATAPSTTARTTTVEASSAAAEASKPPAAPTEGDSAPRDFRGASALGAEARHWKRDVKAGPLHYDLITSTTVHGGATVGLLPNVVVPRFDLSFVTAPFLTLPGGEQTLVGVMPRIRLGVVGPVSTSISGQDVDLLGYDLRLGLCFSPHYDTQGWVLFGCAEYGGTLFDLDLGSGENRRNETHGYANVGLDFTAQYNFTPWFHLGLRAGTEAYVGRDQIPLGDGFGSFNLGDPFTGSASLGLGVTF